MTGPFQVALDASGNLYMQEGTVIGLHGTTVYFKVGGIGIGVAMVDPQQSFVQASESAGGFYGGAGNNVSADTMVLGTLVPDGFFQPVEPNAWISGEFTMIFDPGTGGAEIADNGGVVAELPAASSTVAPYGTFTATTYGEDTYNGSTPFTIDTAYEGATDTWPTRGVLLTCDGIIVQAGNYSRTGWQSWESDDDPLWTMTIDGTGAGVINDGTDDVLTRPADALKLYDPSGSDWESTAYGETTYGSGDPFVAQTILTRTFPVAGYLYVTLDIDGSDECTGVTGPFFGASLPANSATSVSVPIAYSDGAGTVTQIQLGPIVWRPA